MNNADKIKYLDWMGRILFLIGFVISIFKIKKVEFLVMPLFITSVVLVIIYYGFRLHSFIRKLFNKN
ncbi:MAG: hypothetical protein KatS3mg027_1936 [Bacteroidia bacterium]|nr:MAG: hypothetical protein KatS3mg027_1936 [Bacteroidia bacterium]